MEILTSTTASRVVLTYHTYEMYLVTLMRYKVNLKKLFFFLSHREFLTLVGSEKARATNMNCEVIPVVKHDKSEPVVDITYGKYDVSTLE